MVGVVDIEPPNHFHTVLFSIFFCYTINWDTNMNVRDLINVMRYISYVLCVEYAEFLTINIFNNTADREIAFNTHHT